MLVLSSQGNNLSAAIVIMDQYMIFAFHHCLIFFVNTQTLRLTIAECLFILLLFIVILFFLINILYSCYRLDDDGKC